MEKQAADLLRFISGITTDLVGGIVTNVVDEQPNYISRFYTPQLVVTSLSNQVVTLLSSNYFEKTNTNVAESTLTYELMNSDLKTRSPYLYNLCQAAILDSFSLVYTLQENPDMVKYLESSDLKQCMQNISYITDALGLLDAYTEIVSNFQSLYIAIGYIDSSLANLKAGE